LGIYKATQKKVYPKIINKKGESPEQYPEYDDEDEEGY